jgi:hypothetical protein
MTHHNQTKVLATRFLNLSLDEYIDNKKHKVLILNPRHMTHNSKTKSKTKKAKEDHPEEGEDAKSTSGTKSGKTKERAKKSSKLNSS